MFVIFFDFHDQKSMEIGDHGSLTVNANVFRKELDYVIILSRWVEVLLVQVVIPKELNVFLVSGKNVSLHN